jgi:hypothetical protein
MAPFAIELSLEGSPNFRTRPESVLKVRVLIASFAVSCR